MEAAQRDPAGDGVGLAEAAGGAEEGRAGGQLGAQEPADQRRREAATARG